MNYKLFLESGQNTGLDDKIEAKSKAKTGLSRDFRIIPYQK